MFAGQRHKQVTPIQNMEQEKTEQEVSQQLDESIEQSTLKKVEQVRRAIETAGVTPIAVVPGKSGPNKRGGGKAGYDRRLLSPSKVKGYTPILY